MVCSVTSKGTFKRSNSSLTSLWNGLSSGIPPTSSVGFEGRVKGLTSSASKISFSKGLTSSNTGASLEKGLSSSFVSSTAGLSVGIVSASVS